ncbi:MAG TPA: DUF47 family protein [Salinisphaeraceae bacterium]|nr:DUF47 family protein [Salinisphaeraceae bacterium]
MFSLQTLFGRSDRIYDLLQASSEAALETAQAADELARNGDDAPTLAAFSAARLREKELATEISETLIHTFVTTLDREDIEAMNEALYKIPKTVEKFAERYVLVNKRLQDVDFTRRTGLLVHCTEVVVDMVRELRNGQRLEHMRRLQDRLQALEAEADALLLEPYRSLYLDSSDPVRVMLAKTLFEIIEKAIDNCRDVGNVIYFIVLKNS